MNTEAVRNCPKCNAPIPAEAPQGLCPRCVLAAASIATETGQSAEAAGPAPSLESIAAGFPQLEIVEYIGQGGMGMVFKARQKKLDRFVALKLLPHKPGADPAFCERFHREARVLARLSHPNIVAVHDFGEAGPFFYLLMEYVDGVNLRQAMRAGRFTPAQALALVPKICDALQYAHEEGILHRDIKPENLLLDTRGRVKIADFGIAKLIGAKDITLTASGSAIGTPHYMAPEQLERPQDVDQRADVYSLGVVFYEMLTGELPIGRFAPPSEKTPIDRRVDEVVLRTLEKERERRFQSAGDVKTQVEKITASPGAEHGPVGTVRISASSERKAGAESAERARASRPPWSIRAISAALLVGASLFGFMLAIFNPGHLGFGEFVVLSLLIVPPALCGMFLAWGALRDLTNSSTPRRGGRLALLSLIAWPMALLSLAAFSAPIMFVESLQWNVLHVHGPGMMPVVGIAAAIAILLANGLTLRHVLRRWITNQRLPHLDLQALLARFPRRAVWLSGYTVAVVLLLLFASHLRIRALDRPMPAPVVAPPDAPAGFEVAPGEAPGNDRTYRSEVTIPAGYALTLSTVLSSNQVLFKPNVTNAAATLMAPQGQPLQGQLTWRLLANSSLADGAPLQLSLGLIGPEPGDKTFHIATPEPVTVDWVGEPPRLWPPQNGHTKFLLVKGISTKPAASGPSAEWAVGIEARLDPIPDNVLRDLKTPLVTFNSNNIARFDEFPVEAPQPPDPASENEQ